MAPACATRAGQAYGHPQPRRRFWPAAGRYAQRLADWPVEPTQGESARPRAIIQLELPRHYESPRSVDTGARRLQIVTSQRQSAPGQDFAARPAEQPLTLVSVRGSIGDVLCTESRHDRYSRVPEYRDRLIARVSTGGFERGSKAAQGGHHRSVELTHPGGLAVGSPRRSRPRRRRAPESSPLHRAEPHDHGPLPFWTPRMSRSIEGIAAPSAWQRSDRGVLVTA
jgi:hypothetical protein